MIVVMVFGCCLAVVLFLVVMIFFAVLFLTFHVIVFLIFVIMLLICVIVFPLFFTFRVTVRFFLAVVVTSPFFRVTPVIVSLVRFLLLDFADSQPVQKLRESFLRQSGGSGFDRGEYFVNESVGVGQNALQIVQSDKQVGVEVVYLILGRKTLTS